MKISNAQTIFFLSLLGGVCVLISCGPKDDDCAKTKYETIYLSTNELSAVTYSGNDTLRFLTDQNDTCILVGQGKKYFYDIKDFIARPVCPPYASTNYEGYRINYTSIKGNLDFVLELHSGGDNYAKVLIIDIKKMTREYRSGSVGLDKAPPQGAYDPYFISEINLNGSTYSTVYKILSHIKPNYTLDSNSYVLYNAHDGVLEVYNETESYRIIK